MWTILEEFSENFQTASDPPPHTLFSENYIVLFSGGPKFCNEIHSDWRDPPSFFREFIVFPPQNYRKNRNETFWIGNDPPSPPPPEVFQKITESVTECLPLYQTLKAESQNNMKFEAIFKK